MLARLVAAQHGVVSRAQLLWLGFTEAAIKHWIAVGYLIRVERGVYAVGRAQLTCEGHWMPAVLAYGQGALLSHLSAAVHWGMLSSASTRIDVSLPSHRRSRSRNGYRVHRSRLHSSDRLVRRNIPVTSPMRTLLDLADVVSADRVRHAYEQSHRAGLYDLRSLEQLLERSPGRRGLKPLRKLIAEGNSDPPDLRSGLEQSTATGAPQASWSPTPTPITASATRSSKTTRGRSASNAPATAPPG